eukprot:g5109.t1
MSTHSVPSLVLAVLLGLLLCTTTDTVAIRLSSNSDGLIDSWQVESTESLSSSSGKIMELGPFKTAAVCDDPALEKTRHSLEYSYESTGLLELFVVDRDAYEERLTSQDDFVSHGIVLKDSYCIGRSCKTSCNIKKVKNWCLIFWNVDQRQIPVNVTYLYQSTAAHKKKNTTVMILSIACAALVLILVVSCIGCCIARKKQKKQGTKKGTQDSTGSQNNASNMTPLINHHIQNPPPAETLYHPPTPYQFPPPHPPPPFPVPTYPAMMNSASQHSMHDSVYQGHVPVPVSHTMPMSSNQFQQTQTAHNELRQSPSGIKKKSKKTKTSRLAFPI